MLSKEELKLINEVFESLELDGEKDKLKKKISLINKQLEIMEKAQKDAAVIQDEIVALEKGEENEKEEK
jgi:hypothetical protein